MRHTDKLVKKFILFDDYFRNQLGFLWLVVTRDFILSDKL